MKEIFETFGFFAEVRKQMRFGEYSRLPIKIRRFQVMDESAECEWYMRPPDPWNVHLPPRLQQEHITNQSLQDALKVRELIFRSFPQVQRAALKMYRASGDSELELMMLGEVERDTSRLHKVASVVMRARLHGFRFSLAGGVLERLTPTEPTSSL